MLGVTDGSSRISHTSADLPSEVKACLFLKLCFIKGTNRGAREHSSVVAVP